MGRFVSVDCVVEKIPAQIEWESYLHFLDVRLEDFRRQHQEHERRIHADEEAWRNRIIGKMRARSLATICSPRVSKTILPKGKKVLRPAVGRIFVILRQPQQVPMGVSFGRRR